MPIFFSALVLLTILTWLLIPVMRPGISSRVSFVSSILVSTVTLVPALQKLAGVTAPGAGLPVLGAIAPPDGLSKWFVLVINIVFAAGSFYGISYLEKYKNKENECRLHWFMMPVFQVSMIAVVWVSNWFWFLVSWEIMSLSSFLLILFERENEATRKAALNYFVQMHISVLFLMTAVYFLHNRTGSMEFLAIRVFSGSQGHAATIALFLLFFVGFAIKAGFVPFHTWLPHAHPAAPAHVSGIMSGVIVKMGIYGIIRVIMNTGIGLDVIGWIILLASVATAIYGIMQTIVQQDLKRFLAYSTIENIGIIGLGIGTGTLGLAYGQPSLVIFGFGGALLHVLNHGIIKSMLFFATGNLYQAAHTLSLEQLGGLARKMPQTAFFFIFASIAVCAIPPLNGFISEILIYAGLFQGILAGSFLEKILFMLLVMLLTFVGGMALLAFTKASGISLLGEPRMQFDHEINEAERGKRAPLGFLAMLVLVIGFFPGLFIWLLKAPMVALGAVSVGEPLPQVILTIGNILTRISVLGGIFIALVAALILARQRAAKKHGSAISATWGCGYTAPTAKMQYTAGSFSRIFRKLFHPVVFVKRQKLQVTGIFPGTQEAYGTVTSDRIEDKLIRQPIDHLVKMAGKLRIFQNGQIQYYLLYGFVFILLILLMEVIR